MASRQIAKAGIIWKKCFTFPWKLLPEKQVFEKPRQWNYPMNLLFLVCLMVRSSFRLQHSISEMSHSLFLFLDKVRES